MPLKSLIFCLLSGLLFTLITPSFGFWPLTFIVLVPLLFITETRSASFLQLFFVSFIFSYAAASSCFYWIANMSWLALIANSTIYAIGYGLFLPGVALGDRAGLSRITLSLWTVCLWTSLEVLLSDLYLPIPSMAIGYFAWSLKSIIKIADITGVFGVSLWIAAINVLIYSLIKCGIRKTAPLFIIVIIVTCGLYTYGKSGFSSGDKAGEQKVSVDVVYSSVKSEEKKSKESIRGIFNELKENTRQSIERSTDLVVWPETSVPLFLRSIKEKEFLLELLAIAKRNKTPLLIGAISFKNQDNIFKKYNSAFLIPNKGFINQEYHKNFLVPFVEANPLDNILPSQLLQWLPESKFNAGKSPGLMRLSNKSTFGVIICYEAFFPNLVRRAANKKSGFIVNITNDHHAFGNIKRAYSLPIPALVFRAVENHKYLVRAANWGYSMIISPYGEIIKSSPLGSSGYLETKITPNYDETFFSRHGFLFAKILLGATFIWFIFLFRKVNKLQKPA